MDVCGDERKGCGRVRNLLLLLNDVILIKSNNIYYYYNNNIGVANTMMMITKHYTII